MEIILLSFLITNVLALCSFTQHCSQPPYICEAPVALNPHIPPFKENFTAPYACPTFLGQDVCCNDDQNSAMNYKFFLLDETFGHSVGGCDICAANMKYMWCQFTCNPNQAQFVQAGINEFVPNPVDPQQKIWTMLSNFTVTNSLACEIYQSCQKCPYVTQVSAMQSPEGFLQFQGYEGISIGLVWTTFQFSDGPEALDLTFFPCNSNVTSVWGYPIQPCTCNTCLNSCAASYYVSSPTTLEGLDWPVVGIAYLVILGVSMIIFFSKFAWKKHLEKKMRDIQPYVAHDPADSISSLTS
ncbi:unnamed protein product [Blepharisma stoltei]|uniref:Niemann-Pick C1 N-terminal domain-containing protein n=1 Tax=Blepharisma stoltei TaxID=1481888 RepID=A0AAU9J2P0_9CILI|nr:unnamed protein product [Blepharisma stoltei]